MDNFDVLFAKSLSKGGGGTGTDNYNELSNKPQINGNALTGNKTGANLGLQDAITSERKLSSDLIDDTGAENLFVSSTEKSTWGGKQDPATTLAGYGITDAYTKTDTGTQITNAIGALDVSSVGGSGKYISAISETDGKISATAETMDTTPTSDSAKALTSGAVYTALASKQDTLTTAQLDAANSGITAAKLTADEAAISEMVDAGAKNILKFDKAGTSGANASTAYETNGVTFTVNQDYSVTVSGTLASNGSAYCYLYSGTDRANIIDAFDGNHVIAGNPAGASVSTYRMWYKVGSESSVSEPTNGTVLPDKSSQSNAVIGLQVNAGESGWTGNVVFEPMLCTKSTWDASHAFAPYAPTNRELYEMLLALQNGTRSVPALAKAEPETGEEEMR